MRQSGWPVRPLDGRNCRTVLLHQHSRAIIPATEYPDFHTSSRSARDHMAVVAVDRKRLIV
jgi:hypothetical protein